MSVKILDGKWVAAQVQQQIAAAVGSQKLSKGRPPGLAVILVGENPASRAYVASKEKAASRCGFVTFNTTLSTDASHAEVAAAIENYNKDPRVDGILLQLPLPRHLDSSALLQCIDPRKDADGLHPLNQGLLMRGQGKLKPCTPLGSMVLLDLAYSSVQLAGESLPGAFDLNRIPAVDLAGKSAVVVGRSLLVGKPIALMLLERNATVTMAHSKSAQIETICRGADIVIAAVGVPRLVKEDWVRPGAIVIDVGINRLPDGSLCGDVDYASVRDRCAAITPAPGGVGPMTVCMLMWNTLVAFGER